MLGLSAARAELLRLGIPRDTVDAFFKSFLANPDVWRAFERHAFAAIKKRKKIGAKAIMERVRWETEIEKAGTFKVSNSWTAYYARIFAIKYPSLKNYFDFKEVKGVNV